jgi:hypothetical protein
MMKCSKTEDNIIEGLCVGDNREQPSTATLMDGVVVKWELSRQHMIEIVKEQLCLILLELPWQDRPTIASKKQLSSFVSGITDYGGSWGWSFLLLVIRVLSERVQ